MKRKGNARVLPIPDVATYLKSLGFSWADVEELVEKRIPGDGPDEYTYPGLTTREMEVFGLMGRAVRNRKIAEDLGISTKTLDIHRANIGKKLGCTSTGIVRAWAAYQAWIAANEGA